jgi:hypothetical protein
LVAAIEYQVRRKVSIGQSAEVQNQHQTDFDVKYPRLPNSSMVGIAPAAPKLTIQYRLAGWAAIAEPPLYLETHDSREK